MSAEKFLNEADWKKFAKGKDYKDAALLKALAALDKAERAGAESQLAALEEVERQGQVLLKSAKGDKELAAYLDGLDKAVDKQRKLLEKLAEAERKQAQKGEEEDEDDESPALLTSQMIPLLRLVPKGETLHALIASTGKELAVLVARRPISPSRRKLLSSHLGASGGVKYFSGECLFEAKAHTFVLDTAAAGLAKKLKAALLKQTELRFKVRVRGPDPGDVDDDGEDAGPDDAAAATPQQQQQDVERRLDALEPLLLRALQSPGVDAGKLRALSEFAREKAAAGNAAAALQSLAMIEKLLSATPAPAAVAPGEGRFVHHAKARLAWQATRQRVDADLKKLEQAILAHYRDEPAGNDLPQRLRRLDDVLQTLDTALIDTLDAALNASDLARRAELHEQAITILRRYAEFVRHEPLLPALDDNPFVPLSTHQTLLKTLQVLEGSLA